MYMWARDDAESIKQGWGEHHVIHVSLSQDGWIVSFHLRFVAYGGRLLRQPEVTLTASVQEDDRAARLRTRFHRVLDCRCCIR